MKKILLSVALLLCLMTVRAQQTGTISLRVASTQPVPNATLTLMRAKDSATVKLALTGRDGSAVFEHIPSGNYLVSVTAVGFTKLVTAPFLLSDSIDLGTLTLQQDNNKLSAVRVESKKPFIERKLDRVVVNVENSPTATGSSVLEVLERSPGVTVDQSENIHVNGKSGTLIMIDGRVQPLSGTDLATLLKSIPASTVERIDIITNPSARYDAEGTAGIIDIRLKKSKYFGTNGNLAANAGQGRYFRDGASLSLNTRTQKFSISTNFAYARRVFMNRLIGDNHFFDGPRDFGGTLINNFRKNIFNTITGRVSIDYTVSRKTVVGLTGSGMSTHVAGDNRNGNTLFDSSGAVQYASYTKNISKDKRPNGAVNLNLRHTIDSLSNLTADLDYASYPLTSRQDFVTSYTVPSGPSIADQLLSGNQDGSLSIRSLKSDYTRTLKHGTFEAGIKASRVHSDNNLVFLDETTSPPSLDQGLSNQFIYNETIEAAYVNLQRDMGKLAMQLGLRAERTAIDGHQVVHDVSFDSSYLQLFPSIFLSYKGKKQKDNSLSLSRRINRPQYAQLNPFRIIINPTYFVEGNPSLKPESSYVLEYSHGFGHNISATLNYTISANPVVHVVLPADGTEKKTVETDVNVHRFTIYSLSVVAPFQKGKFNSMNNIVLYHSRYKGADQYAELDQARFSYNINSSNSFVLPHNYTAELNMMYQAKEVYGYMLVKWKAQLSLGMQKAIMKKKGFLRLSATDLLYTMYDAATISQQQFFERFTAKRDSRIITLGFGYRFGKMSVAPIRKRNSGAEEEKARAGG